MPEMTKKSSPIKLNVVQIFKEANHYIASNVRFMLCIFAVNMVYMLIFKHLLGGISNPLSIVWAVAYYIFWCFFYRFYYGLRPYFLNRALLGSLAPSTKAMVLMLIIVVAVAVLPVIPAFLGFDDTYMEIYEQYLQSFNREDYEGSVSIWGVFVGYSVFALLAPWLICKPYLAWIAALRGRNLSFRKVGDKARGNYWAFFFITAVLLYSEAAFTFADKALRLDNWLDYTAGTIIFIYTNIIFAKIYDWFYLKH